MVIPPDLTGGTAMTSSHLLTSPIGVSVGLGFKHEITSLDDIQGFLDEWAPSRRGPMYATAYKACRAARDGILTVDQAARAFHAFARSASILWNDEDVDPALAARLLRGHRSGHVG
jgi:hypothetical protein